MSSTTASTGQVPPAFQRIGAAGGAILLAGGQLALAALAPFLAVPFIACLALPLAPVVFLAYAAGVVITVAGPVRDEPESPPRFLGAVALGIGAALSSGLGAILALGFTHGHLLSMSRGHGPSDPSELWPALLCLVLSFLLSALGLLVRRAGPWIAIGTGALVAHLIPLSMASMAIGSRVFHLPMSA
jgi:hypothetical protein